MVGAGVGAFVHASSSSVYSPGNRRTRVDESWPTDGVKRSAYSRQRVAEERLLDEFEARHAFVRMVRIRAALTLAPDAIEQGWLDGTAGRWMARSGFIPDIKGLTLQAVHIDDLADAYRRAVLGSVVGPYNIAAEPVIDARSLRVQLGLRTVWVPPWLARLALRTGWHLGLIPLEPERLDLGLETPLMATDRARDELGGSPNDRCSMICGPGGNGCEPSTARGRTDGTETVDLIVEIPAGSRNKYEFDERVGCVISGSFPYPWSTRPIMAIFPKHCLRTAIHLTGCFCRARRPCPEASLRWSHWVCCG